MCRNFSLIYSAFLDGQVSGKEHAALEAHLQCCLRCRHTAEGIHCLRDGLGALESRHPSEELSSQIIAALHHQARLEVRAARNRADLIDIWRLRLLSQGIGTVISLILFVFMTMAVFQPTYRALVLTKTTFIGTSVDTEVPNAVRLKMMLLDPLPPPPILNPSNALLGFSKSLSEEDMLIATVSVRKDGRASIKKLIETPRDPSVIGRLSNALLQQASFQSPRRNQSNSEAVLMFSTINISG